MQAVQACDVRVRRWALALQVWARSSAAQEGGAAPHLLGIHQPALSCSGPSMRICKPACAGPGCSLCRYCHSCLGSTLGDRRYLVFGRLARLILKDSDPGPSNSFILFCMWPGNIIRKACLIGEWFEGVYSSAVPSVGSHESGRPLSFLQRL